MRGQHCENYDVKRETVHCYPRNVDRCSMWYAWWLFGAIFVNFIVFHPISLAALHSASLPAQINARCVLLIVYELTFATNGPFYRELGDPHFYVFPLNKAYGQHPHFETSVWHRLVNAELIGSMFTLSIFLENRWPLRETQSLTL